MLEAVDADRVGDLAGQAEEELALGDGAGDHLLGHQRAGAGLGVERVAKFRMAEQEDSFVRNEHIVEDDDSVHFFETGGQWLVEVAAAVVQ